MSAPFLNIVKIQNYFLALELFTHKEKQKNIFAEFYFCFVEVKLTEKAKKEILYERKLTIHRQRNGTVTQTERH